MDELENQLRLLKDQQGDGVSRSSPPFKYDDDLEHENQKLRQQLMITEKVIKRLTHGETNVEDKKPNLLEGHVVPFDTEKSL